MGQKVLFIELVKEEEAIYITTSSTEIVLTKHN